MPKQKCSGSHSHLGVSDRESRTTGVIRAYDNSTNHWVLHSLFIVIIALETFIGYSQALSPML